MPCLYILLKFNFQVIDIISREMENRFSETNSELLTCIASLDPRNSFLDFDHAKLLRLAQFYPNDFSLMDQELLGTQLNNFIFDVRSDKHISELKNIGELAIKMVKTRRHTAYPLVYRLIELALVLPIATATVERVFSAMKIVKSDLRNRMGDEWLNDSMCTSRRQFLRLWITNQSCNVISIYKLAGFSYLLLVLQVRMIAPAHKKKRYPYFYEIKL